MSKFHCYRLISIVFVTAALLFILYALHNPQLSFPWSNFVTYTIYAVYGLVTGILCGLTFKYRKNR